MAPSFRHLKTVLLFPCQVGTTLLRRASGVWMVPELFVAVVAKPQGWGKVEEKELGHSVEYKVERYEIGYVCKCMYQAEISHKLKPAMLVIVHHGYLPAADCKKSHQKCSRFPCRKRDARTGQAKTCRDKNPFSNMAPLSARCNEEAHRKEISCLDTLPVLPCARVSVGNQPLGDSSSSREVYLSIHANDGKNIMLACRSRKTILNRLSNDGFFNVLSKAFTAPKFVLKFSIKHYFLVRTNTSAPPT
ncbi:uncharacterized protein LOC125429012 [Sphaerodactylus townsendi]|uniref:uncharacterized protein LOC125429012 n=1 Tax=Sphaerodactylus townsendi TaxID=933632 RepID=UPI0020270AA8|nr:uncharacterized protein LOC125429012 [Sphaerodactylus townsendi]